ncbi:GNAT family N-acetyltransferase [Candidatus Sumerlaeota bacterium]|nr:GNAT family N-acetyltransferase [Candidatus Sumerlaeota bacterium]
MNLIRPLQSSDADALRTLFLEFPYKKAQQKSQSIDPENLAAFFVGAEIARLGGGGGTAVAQRVAEADGGGLEAYGALHRDEWHSGFYGRRFGRVSPFLVYRAAPETRSVLLDALLDAARREAMEHLILRIDASEFGVLPLLQSRGFYLVDCSVKLSARIADLPQVSAPEAASGMTVRPYRHSDLRAVMSLASSSHPLNHYYNDPHLPREDTNRLFEGWIERCCTKLGATIFVLDRAGSVRGFAIYLVPTALNRALGTRLVILDFVCLDTRLQGGGIGRWLIADTLRVLDGDFDMVELRTSENNYPALRCYHSLAMHDVSGDFILHCAIASGQ